MKKLLILAIIAISASAHAEYIEAPAYPAGQAQVNNTASFIHDKTDNFANSLEFTYGINDWLALVAAFDSTDGQDLHYNTYSGGEFTAQFDVLKETDDLPGTALRLTYVQGTGSEGISTLSTMAVAEKKLGHFDNFINIAAGKTVGGNAVGGAEFGVAAQSMYGLNDNGENEEWAEGLEYFGDYGKTGVIQGFAQKGQQLGPILGFQPFKNLDTSLNYLAGLTHDAPRSTVTLEVNLTF